MHLIWKHHFVAMWTGKHRKWLQLCLLMSKPSIWWKYGQNDMLPRFEVTGFSFETMPAEQALLKLTKKLELNLLQKMVLMQKLLPKIWGGVFWSCEYDYGNRWYLLFIQQTKESAHNQSTRQISAFIHQNQDLSFWVFLMCLRSRYYWHHNRLVRIFNHLQCGLWTQKQNSKTHR